MHEWGIIGSLEAARQALLEAWPDGLQKRDLVREAQISDGNWVTFVMQLTRYCYVYEDVVSGATHYYVDPERDDHFERRILPYDRLGDEFTQRDIVRPDQVDPYADLGLGTGGRTYTYHGEPEGRIPDVDD